VNYVTRPTTWRSLCALKRDVLLTEQRTSLPSVQEGLPWPVTSLPHFVCRCGSSSADLKWRCVYRELGLHQWTTHSELGLLLLLANCTNGHTYATVLRPSVVCLFGMYCGKRCILDQKVIKLTAHSRIWEIDGYQNELPWPSFGGCFKVMSTIASHSPLNISNSSETVIDRNLVPRTNNRKWSTGIKCSRDRWRHVTL